MINIQHQSTRLTVTEENAPMYRALIDSGKPPKLFRPKDISLKRDYPVFTPVMTTAEYVSLFAGLNSWLMLTAIEHSCPNFNKPAAMLDATIPVCTEDINPDYVAPVKSPKKLSSAQRYAALRAAILECLPDLRHYAATHGPGPDARLAALLEVLEK